MGYWKGAHGYVVGDSTIYWVLKGFGAVTDTESVGVGLKLNLVYVKNLQLEPQLKRIGYEVLEMKQQL